jgi:Protein of unknown function (DUF2937)
MCVILDRWLCLLTGVAGAVLASQLPGYTLQYMQNLRGRLDELEPMVREFELDVMQYNYTIDEALLECATASGFLDALCNSFESTVVRYEDLHAHYYMLAATSDYKRPFALMGSVKEDIAKSVAMEFEPAIPANDQGFVYALVGFLLLSGVVTVLFNLLRCLCCRKPTARRYRRKQQRSEDADDDDDDTTDNDHHPVAQVPANKDPSDQAPTDKVPTNKMPAVNPDYKASSNTDQDARDDVDDRDDVDTKSGPAADAATDPADNNKMTGYTFVGALYQAFSTKKDNYRRYVDTESGLAVPTLKRSSNNQQQDQPGSSFDVSTVP